MTKSTQHHTPIHPIQTSCPESSRCAAWCVEHDDETGQCASTALQAGDSSVWLMGELPGLEPVMVVDTPPTGGELTLLQAQDLADAIVLLRRAAYDGTAVAQ